MNIDKFILGKIVYLKADRAESYGMEIGQPLTVTKINKHTHYQRWWIEVKESKGSFKHTDFR